MKIGFDAKRAFLNNSGLGNYSRLVIEEVAKQSNNTVFAYTKSWGNLNYKPQNVSIKTPTGFYSLIPRTWRSRGIVSDLKRDGINLYHGLSGELPIGLSSEKIAQVVTIHDLIFLRYPELYKSYDRAIYKKKFRSAVEVADKVVAISSQTKSDLLEFFTISESRIELIYQDCDVQFRQILSKDAIEFVHTKYALPSEYVLSVGTIEKRKNQLLTLKAAKEVGIPVVFIGKHTGYVNELKTYVSENKLEGKVYFLNDVSFSDFPAIYQGASVFMYPSIFEGFGIPILEALRSRVPVITSKGSCFEETGGAATQYIGDSLEEAMVSLSKVLESRDLREGMIEDGVDHAQKFNVEKTIPQLLKVYDDLKR